MGRGAALSLQCITIYNLNSFSFRHFGWYIYVRYPCSVDTRVGYNYFRGVFATGVLKQQLERVRVVYQADVRLVMESFNH
ncbi:hypothetical protein ACFX2I_006906 [Malus domestica]